MIDNKEGLDGPSEIYKEQQELLGWLLLRKLSTRPIGNIAVI
jgi:hypothetical protein